MFEKFWEKMLILGRRERERFLGLGIDDEQKE